MDTTIPLGVCALPPPPPNAARSVAHAHYAHDILAHAGLCYADVPVDRLEERLPTLRVLVTVGDTALPEGARAALRDWVRAGGAWLAIGGTGGLPDLLGVAEEAPAMATFGGGKVALGEGYMRVDHPLHPVLASLKIPLHFFNGLATRAAGGQVLAGACDTHLRVTRRPAVVESAPGAGHCLFIAPDVTGSIVRIQQGLAVTRDGVSAPDGTAPDTDGVLKSDDGFVLDWYFDRQTVRGVPGFAAFLQPVADQWREVVIRAILYLASERRLALPLLWYYPRNMPALAHMSHDTDLNDPDLARRMLVVLEEAGIHSTWCTVLPGYEEPLTEAIRDAGHELAMHFDAMSEGTVFSEEEFDAQFRALTDHLGAPPVTNKNHYLRWEGDTEFFEWCERRGIRLDQSKGASKTGEAGFNFGTCHPYVPLRPNGAPLNVMELPTPTQDLVVFAPAELAPALIESVERHHGVLHLLFHPAHIAKDGVADALLRAVDQAKARGFEWWTARRLESWERARRSIHWGRYSAGSETVRCTLTCDEGMPGVTILWLAPPHVRVEVDGDSVETQTVERYGLRFAAFIFDAAQGEHTLALTTISAHAEPKPRNAETSTQRSSP